MVDPVELVDAVDALEAVDSVVAVDAVGKEYSPLSRYVGCSENTSSECVDIEGENDDVKCAYVEASDLRMALKGRLICTVEDGH